MTKALFIEFADAAGIMAGLELAGRERATVLDAFTPYPVEGLGDALGGGADARRVRTWMLVGGLAAAASAYGLEFYSATIAYPFDVGGRPHNSWPVFMLFPFEFGILSAAVFGLIGLFVSTGLPRLHHPLFEVEGFERASGDRFILAVEPPRTKKKRERVKNAFAGIGALHVREAEL